MSLKERISQMSRKVAVTIKSLDAEVEVMKITLSEAKNLEKLSKACSNDPVVMLAEIGSKWIIDEGVPMLDEKTAKAEVSDTPLEVVMDLVNAFNSVNNIGQAEKN